MSWGHCQVSRAMRRIVEFIFHKKKRAVSFAAPFPDSQLS